MRLRNIPRAKKILQESPLVVKNETQYKGCWKERVFQNKAVLHAEIGMGKGMFLSALARKNPDINYIGIERYPSVLLRAAEKYEGIPTQTDLAKVLPGIRAQGGSAAAPGGQFPANLRLICMDAASVTDVFARGEVGRIYLNFSDPWPKARHARRRLTSAEYLTRYASIVPAGGDIIFKTDNPSLFDFSIKQIQASDAWRLDACTQDLHHDPVWGKDNIMTEYETKFAALGKPVFLLAAVHR